MPRPPRRCDDRGTTTSEYAVGTLGAATCGAVLLSLARSDWFPDLLEELLRGALEPFTLVELLRDRFGGFPRLGHR